LEAVRVRVLFFALYRDLAGASELELELPAGATVETAVELLRSRVKGLARLPREVVVAVNREYAARDTPLAEGDEVALLPPVGGG
jgi:molybdopterin converting factor subunit 1